MCCQTLFLLFVGCTIVFVNLYSWISICIPEAEVSSARISNYIPLYCCGGNELSMPKISASGRLIIFIKNVVAVAAYSRLASRSQAKFHTKKLSPLVRPCAAVAGTTVPLLRYAPLTWQLGGERPFSLWTIFVVPLMDTGRSQNLLCVPESESCPLKIRAYCDTIR